VTGGGKLPATEVYDSVSGTFTRTGDIITPRAYHTAESWGCAPNRRNGGAGNSLATTEPVPIVQAREDRSRAGEFAESDGPPGRETGTHLIGGERRSMSNTEISCVDCLREPLRETPIRVFLIVENRLLREALRRLFRKSADLQIVGERGARNISLQDLLDSKCDVMVIDFFDFQWCRSHRLCTAPEFCELKTILIGMNGDSTIFLEAVRAGVSGYLLKDAAASSVIAATRTVCNGEAVCAPRLCAALFQRYRQLAGQAPDQAGLPRPDLTLRQRQMVGLVARGMTNKEIATQLNLSEFTVRNHVHRILKKAAVRRRRDAVDAVGAWSNENGNMTLGTSALR
jgi:two-component system, NarL family, response regulator DevR